jgi:hypothetical protein
MAPFMAFSEKFSRLLSESDFDLLNTQYGLSLDYRDADDYRHAQVIWNLHSVVEDLQLQLKQKESEGKLLRSPES